MIKKLSKTRPRLLILFVPFVILLGLISCEKKAQNGVEAGEWLTSVKNWKIEGIKVNDKAVFKDGKSIQQFGSVEFSRYMETVNVLKDGRIEGKYNEGVAGTKLKWDAKPDQIIVSAADTSVKGGNWSIYTKDVTPDHFIMQTTTTAYDFPNTTKIELIYKAE